MANQQLKQKNKTQNSAHAHQLEIIYYTDPLCCWSWAMEPPLRRLVFEYYGQINWRCSMGGLLPGWNAYNDEINSVTKPLQMGPLWMHAQEVSGMPVDAAIWKNDPPSSSYPCCIAVKCANLQSPEAGIRYLRLLREAIMIHGKNISRENILLEIAGYLSVESGYGFDLAKFKADMKNGKGLEAFRTDLHERQRNEITRFPTLIIKGSLNKGVILTGYRPYTMLVEALQHVNPQLEKTRSAIDEEAYKSFWGSLTVREAEEISKA